MVPSKHMKKAAFSLNSSGLRKACAMVARGLSPGFDHEDWLQPIEIV